MSFTVDDYHDLVQLAATSRMEIRAKATVVVG